MSLGDLKELLIEYLPNPYKSIKLKREIKSKHQKNLTNLQRDQKIDANFSPQSVNALGFLSSRKHYETVSRIKDGTYSSNPPGSGIAKAIGPSQYYEISDQDNKSTIEGYIKSTIWRIRIENLIQYIVLFVLLVSLVSVLIIVAVILSFSQQLLESIVREIVSF